MEIRDAQIGAAVGLKGEGKLIRYVLICAEGLEGAALVEGVQIKCLIAMGMKLEWRILPYIAVGVDLLYGDVVGGELLVQHDVP